MGAERISERGMRMNEENLLEIIDDEAIHTFFGLSYANYLVLPRSILQSMPPEWQRNFVELLNEIEETFGIDFEPKGGYRILALDENNKFTKDPYSNYERGRRKINPKDINEQKEYLKGE